MELDLYDDPEEYFEEDLPSSIIDNLYLGDVYMAKNIKLLQKLEISAIINATEAKENNTFPDSFTYLHVPLQDKDTQDISQYMIQCIDFIDSFLNVKKKVYVHCLAGVSRSVTIVAYYLMYKKKWSLKQTLEHLSTKRSCILPNQGFFEQLLKLDEEINGKRSITYQEFTKTRKLW